ncbi:hypothetical protein C8R43DRAFT_614758 [Mycena crocata]|nr:hypothetical protein C8R43DRAFT_614758 [Mycena crocata]
MLVATVFLACARSRRILSRSHVPCLPSLSPSAYTTSASHGWFGEIKWRCIISIGDSLLPDVTTGAVIDEYTDTGYSMVHCHHVLNVHTVNLIIFMQSRWFGFETEMLSPQRELY